MLCAIGVNEVAAPALLVMVNGRDYASHCCGMLQWAPSTHVNRWSTLCVLYTQLQAPDSGQPLVCFRPPLYACMRVDLNRSWYEFT